MAKSARASSKKENKTRLRAKVFGPVEEARVARLSARLMQLANKKDEEMTDAAPTEEDEEAKQATTEKGTADEDSMQVDSVNVIRAILSAKSRSQNRRRVEKKRTKPRNQMVFKSMLKKKKKGSK